MDRSQRPEIDFGRDRCVPGWCSNAVRNGRNVMPDTGIAPSILLRLCPGYGFFNPIHESRQLWVRNSSAVEYGQDCHQC